MLAEERRLQQWFFRRGTSRHLSATRNVRPTSSRSSRILGSAENLSAFCTISTGALYLRAGVRADNEALGAVSELASSQKLWHRICWRARTLCAVRASYRAPLPRRLPSPPCTCSSPPANPHTARPFTSLGPRWRRACARAASLRRAVQAEACAAHIHCELCPLVNSLAGVERHHLLDGLPLTDGKDRTDSQLCGNVLSQSPQANTEARMLRRRLTQTEACPDAPIAGPPSLSAA